MANERLEAEFTVPASTSLSASNSGGGATTITATPGATFMSSLVTDLGTQLNLNRAPAAGAWTVSMAPNTGLISIGCDNSTVAIPSFAIDFTSTTLRDSLGFTRNINYAATASQIAADVGAGTWTAGAGYLLNESSGNLSAAFGSPATLTAVGSPSYSNTGPRGGSDKAIGFTTINDQFTGGDNFDPLTGDILIVTVIKVGAHQNGDICGKGWSTSGFLLTTGAAGSVTFWATDGVNSNSSTATGLPLNEWVAVVGALDRSTNQIRVAFKSLSSSTSGIGSASSVSSVGSMNSAGNFTIGKSGAFSANVNLQIAAYYIVVGSGVATGLSAGLATAATTYAATFGTWTGTAMPAGVWLSHTPYNADTDPKQAPTGDDKAASISPTGRVFSLASSEYFRHRNVRFEKVAKQYVWSADATVSGSDWETFYLETQLGHHSWFDVGSRVRIYWDNAGTLTQVGNGSVDAWYMPKCTKLDDLSLSTRTWTGLVDIVIGDIFSDD